MPGSRGRAPVGNYSVPRISIVIPTAANTEALETTLLSVLEHRPPRSEIVVVLGCIYEDPYDLKQEIRFVQAPEGATLVDLINCGIAAAYSEIVHVLACGATVEEDWTASATRQFDDPQIAAAAALVLDAALPTHLLAAGLSWTSGGRAAAFAKGRPSETIAAAERPWAAPHLAGAYYRRSALVECGSLDAAMPPDLAAIDLALRLRKAGKQCVLDCESKVAIDPRFLPVEGGYRQARDAERLFWRHAHDQRSLLRHGFTVVGEVLRDIPHPQLFARLTGRVVGLISGGAKQILPIPSLPDEVETAPMRVAARRVDPAHHNNEKRQSPARRSKERRACRER